MGVLSSPLSRAALLAAGVGAGTLARGGSFSGSRAVALLGAAVYVGASFWTTFVAGIVMFRNLPKDVFGDLQSHLFPAYFLTQAASAGVALAGHAGGWGGRGGSRAGLVAALVSGALNLVALEPLTTKAMYARRAAARSGGPAAAKASKRFGALHGASSAVNLAGLIGMVVHLVSVAGQC